MTEYVFQHTDDRLIDDTEEMPRIMDFLISNRPHTSSVYTWDDIGTATLMSDVYENKIRFCPQQKAWYVWDRCWEKQATNGSISDKLQTLLNLLLLYVKEVQFLDEDDKFIEDYHKYIKSLRKFTAMENVLRVLSTMVRIDLEDFDKNPYILNTTNLAYDLRTGKIVQDITQYNITKKTTCMLPDFATKKCKRWDKFISEIMSGDKEKAAFLKRALGYSILGVNREECMFIAYGSTTRNGKGTLFSSINSALGDGYATAGQTELICEQKNGHKTDFNSPQPSLSRLVGARLVSMAESNRDVRLDTAAIKSMTGRDSLVTRGLFESPFSFLPQFTLWLNTNYLPSVTDDTVFSSNRVWVIEFNEHFDETTQDKDLKEIFAAKENRPTILKWLFDGCREYIENGLNPPESVREATNRYRRMHDRIGMFIEETCVAGADKRVIRGTLYSLYRQWCMKGENRFNPLGSTSFYNEVSVRGYAVTKSNGDWYINGLGVTQ